jgi:hypothetical protein
MSAIGVEAGIEKHYCCRHPNTKWLADDISVQNVSDESNVGNKEVATK